MNVVIVPCLYDNYAYLAVDESSGRAVVVDPSESVPILRKLPKEQSENYLQVLKAKMPFMAPTPKKMEKRKLHSSSENQNSFN